MAMGLRIEISSQVPGEFRIITSVPRGPPITCTDGQQQLLGTISLGWIEIAIVIVVIHVVISDLTSDLDGSTTSHSHSHSSGLFCLLPLRL